MVERRTLLAGGAVLAALLVVGAGVGVYVLSGGLSRPSVESVESEFGTVSERSTMVDTRVVVINPNDRAISGVTIHYTVEMNGIRMARGETTGVTLDPGRNVVTLSTALNNSRIPEWWVTHVERGETTTLTTTARATFANLPFSVSLEPQERTIETDLVSALADDQAGHLSLGNDTILRTGGQQGTWTEASSERTTASLRTSVANRHNRTVQLDGIAYTVRMNDVVVGQGVDEGFVLAPGERKQVTVNAALDPGKMDLWWVSHIRANQTTRLAVDVAGVVERDGERVRIPLSALGTRALVQTDMLGTGNTTVEALPPAEGPSFTEPTVGNVSSRWGEPTDEVTPIVSSVPVRNPNTGNLSRLLRANISSRTTINGLVVAENGTTVPVPQGTSTLRLRSAMENSDVPVWWARHINRGERSRVRTTTTGSADVGVTSFALSLPDRESTVETDLLSGLNNDTDQQVTTEGRTVLVVERTRSTWGNATPEQAPIRVRMRVHNDAPSDATIRDVTYTVVLGNTTLADRTSPDSWTLAPGETRTLETTLLLNNSRMADWWPNHVRRGERSRLTIEARATIETRTTTERKQLDFLSDTKTVETDVLGDGNETAD